ncbi:non-ribosomal peptide synthetase, partial [Clostridium estertheticum]|uniref:amino acid adenylation domain-containing protein n=2 Tax=Clostridium TaxID=1485 RepID=UPI001C0C8E69
MSKEKKLDIDLINLSKEYWNKIISKEYDKIVLNQKPLEHKLIENLIKVNINSEIFNKIIKICKNDNLMIYTIMVTVFKIAISRRFQSTEFLIGIPQHLKSDDIKNNNKFIVLGNNVIQDNMFKKALINEKKEILEVYTHQFYPIKELYKVADIYKKVNIYCCMKNIHNTNQIQDVLNLSNNELTLNIEKYNECIMLLFNYCDDLMCDEVNKIISIFINILNSAIENIDIKVKDIEIISEEEKHKLLEEFNDTKAEYPRDKTINELFEEQVEKAPSNIAVVFEDKEITYKELNERSNSLARNLREKGVGPDVIVGIMVECSVEMIVGIMGILKAGGAYLPIDPEYPEGRIEYILENSKAKIVLTQSKFNEKIENKKIDICDLNNEGLYKRNNDNLDKIANEENLAYVIYTSGTTGNPKGVMIGHKSAVATLEWRKNEYKFTADDSTLQLFSNAFDGFVTSFFTPIISGVKVILVSSDDIKDVFKVKELLIKHKITNFISVPSLGFSIMNSLDNKDKINLRSITFAGEPLTNKLIEKCKSIKETIEITNEYGPTENSVVSTIKRNITGKSLITIGKPIDNTQIYIVDKDERLMPIGIVGELCISGDGLAKGYLNNDKLTKEKFVDNPYENGQKMYKTGDLARWLPDGNIEFLGRIDYQVKIRGFRIELGEVESNLLKIERVKEVVVLDKEEEGSKYLCAYYVGEKEYSVCELREELKKSLPDYMIPSYFIKLENMPLTPSGKTDRKALPEPEGKVNTGAEYEVPRNELEEKLVEIWQGILGVNNIGINDDFFSLGGDSIKSIQVISRAKAKGYYFEIKDLFENSNIKALSKYVKYNTLTINQDEIVGE